MSVKRRLRIHPAIYVGKKSNYLPMMHAMRARNAGFRHTLNDTCTQNGGFLTMMHGVWRPNGAHHE